MALNPRRSSRRTSASALLTPPLTDASSSSSIGGGNNGTSSRSRPANAQSGGVLTVPAPGEDGESNFTFHVQQLYGRLPKDQPYWRNMALIHEDRRGIPAMSLRYISKGKGRLLRDSNAQDDVREKIWTTVRQLCPQGPQQDVLPKVVFTESADSQILDLVFPSCAAGEDAMHEFGNSDFQMKFQTEYKGSKKWQTYTFWADTNSLDGSILPFEIHGLPLDLIDPQALHDGVSLMASPIGKVLGIGSVVMTSAQWDLIAHPSGVVRCYCKLSARGMGLSWPALCQALPTLFKWRGVDYRLTFAGGPLRTDEITSIDYCPTVQDGDQVGEGEEGGEDGEDDEGHTASSTAVAEGSNDAAPSSSASAAKRRRISGRR